MVRVRTTKDFGKMGPTIQHFKSEGLTYVVATKENAQQVVDTLLPKVEIWDEICVMPKHIKEVFSGKKKT